MRQKSDDWRMTEPKVGRQQKNQSYEEMLYHYDDMVSPFFCAVKWREKKERAGSRNNLPLPYRFNICRLAALSARLQAATYKRSSLVAHQSKVSYRGSCGSVGCSACSQQRCYCTAFL